MQEIAHYNLEVIIARCYRYERDFFCQQTSKLLRKPEPKKPLGVPATVNDRLAKSSCEAHSKVARSHSKRTRCYSNFKKNVHPLVDSSLSCLNKLKHSVSHTTFSEGHACWDTTIIKQIHTFTSMLALNNDVPVCVKGWGNPD